MIPIIELEDLNKVIITNHIEKEKTMRALITYRVNIIDLMTETRLSLAEFCKEIKLSYQSVMRKLNTGGNIAEFRPSQFREVERFVRSRNLEIDKYLVK